MICRYKSPVRGLLACVLFAAAQSHAQQAGGPEVLILQSLDSQTSPYNVPTQAFRQRFQEYFDLPVSFSEINLDARWGNRDAREPYQVQLLRSRIEYRPPALVVSVGPSAIDFWLRHRDEFPSRVPSVMAARAGAVTRDRLRPGDAAILSEFSFPQVLDDILRVLPDTKHVVVVFGASELERALTAAARSDLAEYEDRVSFTYTSDLRIHETETLLSNLPAQSAVLFGILTIDAAGRILAYNTALKRLVAASSAPVFGVFEHELGQGIVGGRLIPTQRLGEEMALAAHQTLQDPAADPVITIVPLGEPAYDWNALRNWNIDTALLPPGHEILFRAPTAWDRYGAWIVLTVAVLAAQTALIGALLIARRNRRMAELLGARLSSRLISAHEDERWRIARELHDDLSQRLAGLAIDAGTLSRGPRTQEETEILGSLQRELSIISKDVHDMSYRLHPSLVGDLGLDTALRTEIDRVSSRAGRRIEARIGKIEGTPAREPALHVYRIAQQALYNALTHSDADKISVKFEQVNESLLLEVSDDGRGFDLRNLQFTNGIGISSMSERARLAGGTLHLQSNPGGGTTVRVRVPMGGAEA